MLHAEDINTIASPRRWPEGFRTNLLPVLVGASAFCLLGAFYFPFMHSEFSLRLPKWIPHIIALQIRDWLIDEGKIPTGDHYLWGVIGRLFAAREYFVGWAIFLFSVFVPALKIVLCGILVAPASVSPRSRRALARTLALVAKWSMADVFIVGMIIVFFKAEGFHFAFEARAGIYFYAAAAILSSLAVALLQEGSGSNSAPNESSSGHAKLIATRIPGE